ncbi:BTB/POZ domain-containing protein [Drosera capensis]
MKFMKLGSKLDTLQENGKNTRYMASELLTDIVVHAGEVKFHLHKFPLLSKSSFLQNLITSASEETNDEVFINDIPGGAAAFEVCAKFCYGITVTLSAHNVIAVRCAAEYLGMHETVEKGNLAHKIDIFLSSSIFRGWKDSIIALQTTKSLLPWAEDLKLVGHSIDAIAAKASVEPSKVSWSYSYNWKKVAEEIGIGSVVNDVLKCKVVPKDWWVEDLCELGPSLYKQVIDSIRGKGNVPDEVIGEALEAYFHRKLPACTRSHLLFEDLTENCSIVDTILSLLPTGRSEVSCSFLLKLLKAAILLDYDELTKRYLIKKIGQQLEEATVSDLLIKANEGEATMYDVDTLQNIVLEFLAQDENPEVGWIEGEGGHGKSAGILTEASKLMVAKLTDAYLVEIANDHNLSASKFIGLAEVVSSLVRPSHDGLYRAIDTYIKEHPGISKSERKNLCKLMDCKKLSAEACRHAVQNDRLPLRVIVQVLFFEQVRAAALSGTSTPDLPSNIKDLNSSSSSRSNANADDDWDSTATVEELKALRNEVAVLRLERGRGERISSNSGSYDKVVTEKSPLGKVKGLVMSNRIFSRLRSTKNGHSESSSDSSETATCANVPGIKSAPSSNRTSFS